MTSLRQVWLENQFGSMTVDDGDVRIGSDANNDLQLRGELEARAVSGSRISIRHCLVIITGTGFGLYDGPPRPSMTRQICAFDGLKGHRTNYETVPSAPTSPSLNHSLCNVRGLTCVCRHSRRL